MAECGLLNFASCLPQKFAEYIAELLTSPLQPLLDMVKGLLSAQVNIELFVSLWAIIIYVISMFYAFLLIYSGFTFIISGYDAAKREHAKEWLRNIIIMIILIQASFFIYQLGIELGAVMTSAAMNLIDQKFFILTVDNISNIALQIIFVFIYILALLLTALILIVRYAIVAIGVVLFPLGIFFYFIPPLRSYGILILNFLGIAIFISFLNAVILIGFSKLVELSLFANIKILVTIAAFLFIDIMMFFLMFFSIIKAAISVGTKVAALAAKIGVVA